jgi:hypothetical protein
MSTTSVICVSKYREKFPFCENSRSSVRVFIESVGNQSPVYTTLSGNVILAVRLTTLVIFTFIAGYDVKVSFGA